MLAVNSHSHLNNFRLKSTMFSKDKLSQVVELGFNSNGLMQLQSYLELLWVSNEELNLISRKMTFDELINNHVIDCLLPLQFFPKGIKNIADFGSGGGLPAVLYAIQFPEINFILYEKSKLKQDFLNKCKTIAPNLVIEGEIPLKLNNIDLVTARAFKPIDVILQVSRNYYLSGGRYFLLKGRIEKINEEVEIAKKKFKDLKVVVQPLRSPVLEVERHLVQI